MSNAPTSSVLMKRILKISFYLLLLFLFQEVVFRFAFPITELANFDRVNYLSLKQKPEDRIPFGRSKWYWQSFPDTAIAFEHQLNSYGFRDTEWKTKAPKGKKRLLMVGDSFVEGVMAPQNQSLPEAFKTAGAEKNWEVMNAGILGTGIEAYLQLVADAVPIFKPDVVMVAVFANDFTSRPIAIPEDRLVPEYHSFWSPRLWQWWQAYQHDRAMAFRWELKSKPWLPAVPAPNHPWTKRGDELRPHVTAHLAEAIEEGKLNFYRTNEILQHAQKLRQPSNLLPALRFLKSFTQKHGSELVIVYLPARHQVTNYYYQFDRKLCQINCPDNLDLTGAAYHANRLKFANDCQRLDLAFLDLTATVLAHEKAGNHLFWSYDDHFRPHGYSVAGYELFRQWSIWRKDL